MQWCYCTQQRSFLSCLSHIFFSIFFFCTLKVCKPRHRHKDKSPSSTTFFYYCYHFSVFVRGELSPQIEGINYVTIVLSFRFLFPDMKKDDSFVVMMLFPQLCEHDLSGSLIVRTFVCLLHIIIYWSYLSIYALLPWHFYQGVCVLICTHTLWSMTIVFYVVLWFDWKNSWLDSQVFARTPRMLFSLSSLFF